METTNGDKWRDMLSSKSDGRCRVNGRVVLVALLKWVELENWMLEQVA